MSGVMLLRYVIGGLAVAEFVGLVVFVVMYRRSDWRSEPIGRNLMYWAVVLIVVYAASSIARFWPSTWIGWVLAGAHAAFAAVVWHRIVVLHRYQHTKEGDLK